MIAELIFKGSSADDLGMSTAEFLSRKKTLGRYLEDSGGVFTEGGYLEWVAQDGAGKRGSKPVRQTEKPEATGGHNNNKQLPGLSKQAVSLSKAVMRHVAGGSKKIPVEESNKRIAICEACDLWIENGTIKVFGKQVEVKRRCSACGCAMDVKATWATSHCIQGKW